MKIIIQKKIIQEGIQSISKIVPTRTTIPILSNVLISCYDNQLKMVTTDLEMSMQYIISTKIINEGTIAVPVKIFQDLINNFPEAQITLEVEGNILKITSGNSSYTVNGLNSEEFPLLPEIKEGISISIPSENFKNMVNKTYYSVAPPLETRVILTGIFLEISKKELKMVSTDGHRLSLIIDTTPLKPSGEISVVIPARALNEVSRLANPKGEVQLTFSENQVKFDLENITLITRTIEGQFPPYQQVITTKDNINWRIEREVFLQAVRRSSIIARDDGNIVKIKSIKNEIEITAGTSDVGNAYEKVQGECKGESLEIAFNAGYLLDFLTHVDSKYIIMELVSSVNPVIMKSEGQENYISVIMPVRIS